MTYLLLALAGIAVGTMGSMLGIGGGIFMVPLLLFAGLVPTFRQAVGTSIAAVAVNGVSATVGYLRQRAANWRVGFALIPGAVAGGWLGPWLMERIGSRTLELAFAVFLLYPAAILFLGKQPKELFRGQGRTGIGVLPGLVLGLAAGTAGGLFGIGGGVIMVPALTFLGLDIVPAVATSLFVMIPSAGTATLRHSLAGNTRWEYALPLSVGVIVGSQLGPILSRRVPGIWLRRLLSLVLVYTSIYIAFIRPG